MSERLSSISAKLRDDITTLTGIQRDIRDLTPENVESQKGYISSRLGEVADDIERIQRELVAARPY